MLVKSNNDTSTDDEMQVLKILEHHAKESIDAIAKKCGFSRQKVWRIIKQLQEHRIIWGYTAITSGKEKDLKHFIMLLKRSMVPIDESLQKEIIFEKLDDYLPPGIIIENISSIHGQYDVFITFYAPNLVTAKKVPEAIFQRLGKYVVEYILYETLLPIRKQGFKNPQIHEFAGYI